MGQITFINFDIPFSENIDMTQNQFVFEIRQPSRYLGI